MKIEEQLRNNSMDCFGLPFDEITDEHKILLLTQLCNALNVSHQTLKSENETLRKDCVNIEILRAQVKFDREQMDKMEVGNQKIADAFEELLTCGAIKESRHEYWRTRAGLPSPKKAMIVGCECGKEMKYDYKLFRYKCECGIVAGETNKGER